MSEDFYCRYYVGHKGKFGHEYMEFELTANGRLRYSVFLPSLLPFTSLLLPLIWFH